MMTTHPAADAFLSSVDQLDAVIEAAVLIAFVDGYLHRDEVSIIKDSFARISKRESVLYSSMLTMLDQKCIALLNDEIDIKNAMNKISLISNDSVIEFAKQLFEDIVEADGEIDEAETQLLDLIKKYI